MQQTVVSIATEWDPWHLAPDPRIECVVQEQIGQNRAHNAALRRPFVAYREAAILLLKRSRQPALDVQQHPTAIAMMAKRLHQHVVTDVVEETPDVELYNPVVLPAPFAGDGNGVMG